MEVRYAWNTPGMDEKGVALPAYFTKHRFQPLPAGLNQQPSKIPLQVGTPTHTLKTKELFARSVDLCRLDGHLCRLEPGLCRLGARFVPTRESLGN